MIGTRLASYEIVRQLGKGGMGEVYLARDAKLDREVAIKVLPEIMSQDKERVARFEREAKLLASLNHPNIAGVYGFDEDQGKWFLVLEYVEGVTLGEQLKTSALSVEDALDIGKQVAEALEAAHGKGIIHRDLKPSNVMVRADGTVKVLDFGLAKAMADEPSNAEVANSPTITANYTRPGVVLGTAAYMSPEQARGRAVDKRTDIWSFGILLFECLTGTGLFQGETANDSMGAIMHKDPEWSLLPAGTPPTIQLMIRRCLTKDRKRRLHDIADARIELENALVDPASTSLGLAQAALDVRRKSTLASLAPWLVAILATAGLVSMWMRTSHRTEPIVAKLLVDLPEDLRLGGWPSPLLSPDGKNLFFVGRNEGGGQIVQREMSSGETRFIAGTAGVEFSLSPDQKWLYFARNDELRKLSLLGGPVTTICSATSARGHVVRNDGTIIIARERTGGLSHIAADGSDLGPFTTVEANEEVVSHRHPYLLPDERGVLFTATRDRVDWNATHLMLAPFDGGPPRVLVKQAAHGRYVAPGYLVFLRSNTLMAAPFNLDRLELTGEAIPILDNVGCPKPSAPAQFSIADNGTLVYLPDIGLNQSQFVKIDFEGNVTPVSTVLADYESFAMSPDGNRIACVVNNDSGVENLMILDLRRNLLRPLDAGEASFTAPVWSPDGAWLAFGSASRSEYVDVYRIRTDFSEEPELLTQSDHYQYPSAWSPDGKFLVFVQRLDDEYGLMALRFDQESQQLGEAEVFVDRPKWQCCADFSNDGKWVIYGSGETGTGQHFVRSVDGGATEQISSGARVDEAEFSPIENKIFYEAIGSTNSRAIFAIGYSIDDGRFQVDDEPVELFSMDASIEMPDGAQITPDGKYFLALQRQGGPRDRLRPKIIINWTETIKEKLPLD